MKSIFFPPKIDYLTQNITINHSNEFPLGSSGEIVGWTNVQGEWKKRSENPIAFDGESYFFAGASSFAELRQDISIEQYTTHDSSLYFDISAHTRSYHEGDYSRIIIQLLDGSKVISEYDSGEMEHKLDWTPVEMRGQVETHSDTIRIRLISRRKKGHNNDGYFDLVSCRLFTKT
jgi:hypothetical protein